jgi:outer membrane protein assembly factor BamB
VFLVISAVGAGYYYYDGQARARFSEIDVTALVAAENFASARQEYEDFLAQHPLTTSVQAAQAELQKIDSAQQMYEARLASARAEREVRLLRLRDQYVAAWERHRKDFLAGRTEQAFATLEQVQALVAEAGQPADVEWALRQKLQLTYENLRDYLHKAEQLGRDYDERIAAADYAGARALALQLHEGFETTAEARRVRVPVMIRTRPAGALLLHDGEPLVRVVQGREEPLRTPGLVLCAAGQPFRLTAQREGFVDLQLGVDCRAVGELDLVMEVVPQRVLEFGTPAQTGVGVGGGWVALGLRGGLLGYGRADGTKQQVLDLGGLKSVEGTPAIANDRIFFLSNEGAVECLPVEPTARRGRWPVTLTAPAATPLCVAAGRVALVDREHRLRVWEQASGRELWVAQLPSAPSGPPVIARRKAYVGTRDGSVVVFDVSDGSEVGKLQSPAGLTTRVHVSGDMLLFGCDDGAVRAVDFAAAKVSWVKTVGEALEDANFTATSGHVLVASAGRVVMLDRASGVMVGAAELGAPIVQLRAQAGRGLAVVRRAPASRDGAPRDVLVAVEVPSAEVLWEYALSAVGPGEIGVNGATVAMPTPRGEVVLFR